MFTHSITDREQEREREDKYNYFQERERGLSRIFLKKADSLFGIEMGYVKKELHDALTIEIKVPKELGRFWEVFKFCMSS